MKKTRIASLVPGRVKGILERDPRRSRGDKVLVARQGDLASIAVAPAGLILVEAAPFSHPVIRWLGRGIPVGLVEFPDLDLWEPQEPVVLDTACGELREWDGRSAPEPWAGPAAPALGRPVRLIDGTAVFLCASVSDGRGASVAVANGAESIRLGRSEYLFPADGSRPTKDFFRQAFGKLLELVEPLSISIRLLDLTADKWPEWLAHACDGLSLRSRHGSQLYSLEAVRDVVQAQLAAVAELEAAHRLRLIWPSGGPLEDFVPWRDHARKVLPGTFAIGAMIESPLEIMGMARWRREADFLSVGCNDLLSHLNAADRDDPQQRHLLDPYRPEVFRFLGLAAEMSGRDIQDPQLCGLLPQIEGVLPILIGLGFRRFSGEPTLIPLLARRLVGQRLEELEQLAAKVCAAETSEEVRSLLGVSRNTAWGLVAAR